MTPNDWAQLHLFWHHWWWAFLIAFISFTGFVGEQFTEFNKRRAKALEIREGELAQRKKEMRRIPPTTYNVSVTERRKPGRCEHRNVVQIRTTEGELVGWLCQQVGCEKRLPRDWAVPDDEAPEEEGQEDG